MRRYTVGGGVPPIYSLPHPPPHAHDHASDAIAPSAAVCGAALPLRTVRNAPHVLHQSLLRRPPATGTEPQPAVAAAMRQPPPVAAAARSNNPLACTTTRIIQAMPRHSTTTSTASSRKFAITVAPPPPLHPPPHVDHCQVGVASDRRRYCNGESDEEELQGWNPQRRDDRAVDALDAAVARWSSPGCSLATSCPPSHRWIKLAVAHATTAPTTVAAPSSSPCPQRFGGWCAYDGDPGIAAYARCHGYYTDGGGVPAAPTLLQVPAAQGMPSIAAAADEVRSTERSALLQERVGQRGPVCKAWALCGAADHRDDDDASATPPSFRAACCVPACHPISHQHSNTSGRGAAFDDAPQAPAATDCAE